MRRRRRLTKSEKRQFEQLVHNFYALEPRDPRRGSGARPQQDASDHDRGPHDRPPPRRDPRGL